MTKCRECKERKAEVQCLRKPWTAPVKLCERCARETRERRWYGGEK